MNFDVVVIGGGINGAGIARDAALRGFRVCLVEQGDLAGATSRWCTRLIHGGLRYLEHGELGLVYECLRERETLLQVAPHLVQPLPLIIPHYHGARRSPREVSLGLTAYDLLASRSSLPRHERLGEEETLLRLPGLLREGLLGADTYYDAQATFPERLVVENAIAARRAEAEVRTYTHVDSVAVREGRVAGVLVTDLRTGQRELLEAEMVVNASGPWVDELLATLGGAPEPLLGTSRGTHIVTDPLPAQRDAAVYAEAAADGRPFFVIPWNGLTLVGTTDVPYTGDPGAVHPTAEEVDYLLREVNRLWPGLGLTRARVHYAYAGVRPLARGDGRRGAAATRRHHIRHHRERARGLWSVIGGKLTTYRSLAEQVVDQLARHARRDLIACETATRPLPGAGAPLEQVRMDLARAGVVPTATADRLARLYGSRALDVERLVKAQPALGEPLAPGSAAIAAEIPFAFQTELAVTFADCMLRRTMLGLDPDLGAAASVKALAVAARALEWDEARVARERARYVAEANALRLAAAGPARVDAPGLAP